MPSTKFVFLGRLNNPVSVTPRVTETGLFSLVLRVTMIKQICTSCQLYGMPYLLWLPILCGSLQGFALFHITIRKLMFVKHGCPRRQQSQNKAKISKSYILTLPHPRCTWCQWSVSNPKMNLQSKFGYCIITQTLNITLFVSGMELRTNEQSDY